MPLQRMMGVKMMVGINMLVLKALPGPPFLGVPKSAVYHSWDNHRPAFSGPPPLQATPAFLSPMLVQQRLRALVPDSRRGLECVSACHAVHSFNSLWLPGPCLEVKRHFHLRTRSQLTGGSRAPVPSMRGPSGAGGHSFLTEILGVQCHRLRSSQETRAGAGTQNVHCRIRFLGFSHLLPGQHVAVSSIIFLPLAVPYRPCRQSEGEDQAEGRPRKGL